MLEFENFFPEGA